MTRSGLAAGLLLLAVAPSHAAIGPFTVAREGMPSLLASATGGGVSVVAGENGAVWTSTNGVSWTARVAPFTGARLNGIAYAAGRFVAVGRSAPGTGVVLVSSNGTSWRLASTPPCGELFAVAHGGGRFLAVGPGTLAVRSNDGLTWSSVALTAGETLTTIAYGSGQFVAGGQSRRLLTSRDGVAWTDRTASVPFQFSTFRAMTWTGSRFVAVGVGGILSSATAISWTRVHTVSQDAVTTGPGVVVASRAAGFSTSPDGEVWTQQTPVPSPGVAPGSLTLSFGGGRFVAGGSAGALRVSPDGASWTDVTLPASRQLSSVAYGAGRFCAVDWEGGTATSADGLSWTNGPSTTLKRAHEVGWTGHRFVAVGQQASGFSPIATSPDCVSWTPAAAPLPPGAFSVYFDAVTSADGRVVAVGAQVDSTVTGRPVLYASTDGGDTFAQLASGVDAAEGALWGVTYGGGRWVAAGQDFESSGGLVTTSTDGVLWSPVVGTVPDQAIDSVVHTPAGFVAAGGGIWTSPDGSSWTTRLLTSDYYLAVRYSAGRYVAVGGEGPAGGVIATSPDGLSWTEVDHRPQRLWGVAFPDGALQLDRVAVVGESLVLSAAGGLPRVSAFFAAARESDFHVMPPLLLSAPASVPVTVSFATADGSAVGGADYDATAGVVTFLPGTTNGAADIPLRPDGVQEGNEFFALRLTEVSGAVVQATESSVVIIDTPTIAADDTATPEGNAGPSPAGLVVRLSHSAAKGVTVAYATGGGTATPGVDYMAAAGTLSFAPGVTAQVVPVSVLGDTAIEQDETFAVSLESALNASVADPSAEAVIQDDDAPPLAARELAHGMQVRDDFADPAGADTFRIAQAPRASYEIEVDAVAGAAVPVVLERLAADNATVVDAGAPIGTGTSVSLRWANGAAGTVANQHVRVRAACATACSAGDAYRLRAYETTLRAPRFSNVGGQVTLLVLQNPSDAAAAATAYFWAADGSLLQSQPIALAPRRTSVLNTASVAGLAGRSGSVTVAHTAPYGVLAGKAVAVEPATGFGFDTPMTPRPR